MLPVICTVILIIFIMMNSTNMRQEVCRGEQILLESKLWGGEGLFGKYEEYDTDSNKHYR